MPPGETRCWIFAAACDITAALTDFRTALGTLNPNVPGEVGQSGGRREVNWDAAGLDGERHA